MRTIRNEIIYKLPPEFVERHRAVIEAINWSETPAVVLDLGWPVNPIIEAVSGRGTLVVRPATLKSANLIRKSVEETP